MAKPTSLGSAQKLVRVDEWPVTRVQAFNISPQMTSEAKRELGNRGIVETAVDTYIPNTVTLNTLDWATTDLWSQLMGENATADALYSGASADRNDFTIDEDDFAVQECDFIQPVTDPASGALLHSIWVPNAYITQASLSYSVDGDASENFTFEAYSDYALVGKYKDAYVQIGTYDSSSTFTVTTEVGSPTFAALYVSINDVIYDAATYVDSWTTDTVTLTGVTVADGDRIRLVYYRITPAVGTYLDTRGIASVRGSFVQIGLHVEGSVDGDTKTLRIQNAEIQVTVNREEDKEIGTEGVIGRSVKYPIITSVTLTINENDLEEYATLCGLSASWAARESGGLLLRLQDTIGQDNELWISVYDQNIAASGAVLQKLIKLTNLRVTGRDGSHEVDNKGQVTWTFEGDNIELAGQGNTGRLATAYPTAWPTT